MPRKTKRTFKSVKKITREVKEGYVVRLEYPKDLLIRGPVFVLSRRTNYNVDQSSSKDRIERVPETTYSFCTAIGDAMIYHQKVHAERELVNLSAFLEKSNSQARPLIERVKWVPKEVIRSARQVRKPKKFPAKPNKKLIVRVAPNRDKIKIDIRPKTTEELVQLARETALRETQTIEP